MFHANTAVHTTAVSVSQLICLEIPRGLGIVYIKWQGGHKDSIVHLHLAIGLGMIRCSNTNFQSKKFACSGKNLKVY